MDGRTDRWMDGHIQGSRDGTGNTDARTEKGQIQGQMQGRQQIQGSRDGADARTQIGSAGALGQEVNKIEVGYMRDAETQVLSSGFLAP